ncbi:MAG: chemotaxis protein CheB, partial [Lachnospiraceae bacterium]|nr:chemotaxis protein CheB [Lachnospiraceae bacterium]
LNAPVVVVQHMPMGFTKSLADRLNELSSLTVKEAEEGDLLEKGHVYIAPGDKHLKVAKSGSHTRIYFSMEPKREGVRPCANYMFETIAGTAFEKVCCVVLTGMGADGTAGIKELEKSKQIHIIAQDEATCAVYGMPRAIANTGLVNEVLPLERIAGAITKEVGLLG